MSTVGNRYPYYRTSKIIKHKGTQILIKRITQTIDQVSGNVIVTSYAITPVQAIIMGSDEEYQIRSDTARETLTAVMAVDESPIIPLLGDHVIFAGFEYRVVNVTIGYIGIFQATYEMRMEL